MVSDFTCCLQWTCPLRSLLFLFMAKQLLVGQGLPVLKVSRSHSVIRITLGKTPLDKWYPDAANFTWQHNIHNRQTSMPSAVFEPTIPTSERQQTHVLDRAATGTGWDLYCGGGNGQCKIQNCSAERNCGKCKFYVVVSSVLTITSDRYTYVILIKYDSTTFVCVSVK